jgi:hypothetical protein
MQLKKPKLSYGGALLALLIAFLFPQLATAQTTPPYALRELSSNFMSLTGVTLDAHGNVYVVDDIKQLVEEFIAVNGVVPSNPTVRTLGSGYSSPRSVALDTAGDLFVANYGSLVELMAVDGSIPDNPTISTVATLQGSDQFGKITVDGLGNLEAFVSGDNGEAIIQLEAVNGTIPASPVIRTLFSVGGSDIGALASDSKGNVYYQFFNLSNTSIYELSPVNGRIPDGATGQPILLEPEPPYFQDFAVDSSGNLFIAEIVSAETCSLVKVSAVNGTIPPNPTQTTLYSAPQATFRAYVIALDANDNMFISDEFTTGTGEGVTTDELAEVSPASVTLTPATMNFGDVPIGTVSADQTATLTNNGTAALPVNEFTVTGSNPGGFGYTDNCSNSLAAGASCTIQINCDPAIVEALSATFNASFGTPPAAPPQSIALSCNGTATSPTPQAALTPATANFGSVNVGGASASQLFTLANAGTASLPITSIALTGANASAFTIGANTCGSSLAASTSCTIRITFNPTAAGNASASLGVVDSVGTQTSSLSGTGTAIVAAPAATLTPATLAFGSVTTGTSSTAQSATLTNTGNAALTITGITITGANASVFSETNTCGSSLAAGAKCTLSIVFAPTTAGADTATLSVADNAPGSPQTSSLTGTGAIPVPAADFGLAATPAKQSVSAGSAAAYSVQVTSADGSFTQPVALSATGLPGGANVSFSPASVTPGSAGATSTMTVQTSTQTAAINETRTLPRWPIAAPALAAVFFLIPFRRLRRWRSLLCLALFSLVIGGLSGCGGGFGLANTTLKPSTYTITVTGTSGSITHSTSVQITVAQNAAE